MFRVPDRKRSVALSSIHLSLGNRVPAEVQLPVESTIGHIRACHVFKRLVADHINDGAHHCFPGHINIAREKMVRQINKNYI